MKKKLFLVLCSCFAGALALSSCGGGGGGNENLSDLLRPFVNGNYVIDFSSNPSVTVVGQNRYDVAKVETNEVAVYGVPIRYGEKGSNGTQESGYANYSIRINADGVPDRMFIVFYGLSEAEADNLLPFNENIQVIMRPDDVSMGFIPQASGQASTTGGVTVDYFIHRP